MSAGKYLFSVRHDSAMENSSSSGWIAGILQTYVTGLVVYDPRHNERVSRRGATMASSLGVALNGSFVPAFHTDVSYRVDFRTAV